MIRVLSGIYKGRKLQQFKMDSVRPTQSRIKKSIMDTITDFKGKVVLDLFSGIGNLGIESISRGAKEIYFVDKNIRAVKVLKNNLKLLNIENQSHVVISDVFKFLSLTKLKFDIIIADPPYYTYEFLYLFEHVESHLNKNGIFCFESHCHKLLTNLNVKIKKFGNTQVIFWRKSIWKK